MVSLVKISSLIFLEILLEKEILLSLEHIFDYVVLCLNLMHVVLYNTLYEISYSDEFAGMAFHCPWHSRLSYMLLLAWLEEKQDE